MSDGASLSCAGLRKAFGSTEVLAGLELEVPAGSLTAVLGPSGCGKTTLLRLLGGFERADAGTIRLGERVLSGPGVHLAPERREIGFVPQEGALFPHLDVAANVGFGLSRGERRGGRVEQLLALLDEPFDALDAGLRAEVRAEVRSALHQAGATALLVTHDQEEALSLADRVAVMRAGRIVQAGEPRRVYADPVDVEVALFLGDAVMLRGPAGAGVAETALGRLALRGAGAARAEATMMLRPEQISCHDRSLDGAPRGRVTATEYFDHDAFARIAVGELEVTARRAGHRLPAVGAEVSILVEGSALTFA